MLSGATLGRGRPARAQRVLFPVAVERNGGRHLVDRAGRPFLYQADTAWLLFMKLTRDEAVDYLRDRRIRGFTAIQAMLTGWPGMANRFGERPFEQDDFIRPNERYFDLVDQILRSAEALDLVAAIAPAWSGCCGEGWAAALDRNGPERCRGYGRWLGQRYRRFGNVMWLLGGDGDPERSRESWRALAQGLREGASHHLITYHPVAGRTSTEVWPEDPSWLDVDLIHHRGEGPVAAVVSERYRARVRARPIVVGQAAHEGPAAGGSPRSARALRAQAYGAVLAGASGHAYGAAAVATFTEGWRQSLDLPGAATVGHLRRLLDGRGWQKLVPDDRGQLVVDGHEGPAAGAAGTVTAARAKDGSFALVYLPSPRKLVLDLRRVGARKARWSWFDPRTGTMMSGGRADAAGRLPFVPPAAAGVAPDEQDWILVLEDGTPPAR